MSGGSSARAVALPATDPPLGPVLDFLRLVWAVDQRLHLTSKRMLRTIGITGPQRLALRLIGRFPGITAGRLAELLRVHPSTVSGLLKRLERRGLIRRRADTRDRRRAYLGLTTQGRRLDVEAGGTVEGAVRRVLDTRSAAALQQAREVLTALERELRAEEDQAAPATVEATGALRRRIIRNAPR